MEALLHEGKTFEKISYSGKEVKGREFEGCTFRQCDFSNSNFSHNRFVDCQFIGCNLAMMKLNGTSLRDAIFEDCKLTGINFHECEDFLFSVQFEGCILDYASFMKKKMPKTKFSHTSLKNVDFSNANLAGAMFDNTNLEGAVFSRTELKEANFLTAYNFNIDPEINSLTKARFSLHGIPGLLTKYKIRVE
ncbi:pentapeptide repeat-containing protein [Pontibacter akesuensis]|uniref:Uncharacterized protein YjbI, contains pentapeptide repeats n=1 Tax=Pontibacter akesuensis TaxID=388950 RepID=A0A1I7J3H3_9BACT|nr:pentapeptide repeat-containing protein [Pontibacter akesuensis]GHA72619.1 hypothetical protein GCM10007389_27980 [Pontibacter akesuensis]SFU79726.1 Uncharacterized protein YjbI, contains pentapeptide repeats [Pontibacter akesuensis]